MKVCSPLLLLIFGFLLFTGCKDENPADPGYVPGKNRYTIISDDTEREYYVHVPADYNEDEETPVVFMLHGTSGNGNDMWDRSGWKEVGESENILTVFPSSLRYCIIDEGQQKNITKWNTVPVEWEFCPTEDPRDDIRFLTDIIAEITDRFSIDEKRIYLVGFSNGGQMSSKASVEMGDKFAAVISNAGSFYFDTTYIPKRKLPTTFQIGNEDYGPGGTGPEIPLSKIDLVLSDTQYRAAKVASTHIKTFGLSPDYIITGDTNTAVIATYPSLTPGSPNDYRFVFVKGLKHAYPNGENHWMEAAVLHWQWLKQYSIP